ncbi:MAG: 16S rRNA (guanine(527)-N(7))-methyltransferase RsmG [Holosporaceae bacterium]|jgi:16S rRNA (guanine527-N7)-methyltransferase|nr:16S rRNA (guanine(527)-N(7))-methyltransferase RsmG [Holosporaceae bacterium]
MIPFNVSRETYEKLETYKNLLLKWQKAVNLVSRGTLDDIWNRHIADSLQIIPYVEGKKVLDVGSGGGFPGMVLAIAGDFSVVCVDSDRKKMLFLAEVARAANAKVTLITERVENLSMNGFDTICARGFSELSNLLKIVDKFSAAKYGVFLKGAKLNEEIERAKILFDFQWEVYPSKTDCNGKIVLVRSLRRRK